MDCYGKANSAGEETKRKTAEEKMNMKITAIQMKNYAENRIMPTLQVLADELCEDNDMEYVHLKEQEQASLEKITVGDTDSILTKLKAYPYEFEINSNLQLASIDGIKVANNEAPTGYVKQSDYDALEARVLALETSVNSLKSRETVVLYDGGKITSASESTTYDLSDSIENYTFIIIESVGGPDPNSWRNSEIYSVKEMINTDNYNVTCSEYDQRWCRLTFDDDSFCVPGLDGQYPIRIIGIKI